MPYRLNPFTGKFDYFQDGGTADDANRIEVTRVVNGLAISKYDPVSLVTATEVVTADVDTKDRATIFGLALHAASPGEDIRILIFGMISDPVFTYPLNDVLYNSSAGPISLVATTIVGEFFTPIGKSNGAGSILVDPGKPTEVT